MYIGCMEAAHVTINQARTLVTGDKVEWIEGANDCPAAIGTVGFDQKTCSSYVDWLDGQRTWLNDGPALPCMRVAKKSATVNGFPR